MTAVTKKFEPGFRLIDGSDLNEAFDEVNSAIGPAGAPAVVATGGLVAQAADVNQPSFYAVTTSGFYRVSTYIVVTRAATTSFTMPAVNVAYTDADTSEAVQNIASTSVSTNLVGLHSSATIVVSAQQGSNIGYSTTGYASAGATAMQYTVRVVVERLQ